MGKRIGDFRTKYKLGHVWEFADSYGDIIFESADTAEIVRAIERETVPRDAKCRRNKLGEWRTTEEALAPEFPEIAALFKKGAASACNTIFYVVPASLVMAL